MLTSRSLNGIVHSESSPVTFFLPISIAMIAMISQVKQYLKFHSFQSFYVHLFCGAEFGMAICLWTRVWK